MESALMRVVTRRLDRAFETGRIVPYLVSMIVAVAVIFAVVMRIVDSKDFPTLGTALWWSVSTVTTVGYGDVVPKQPVGRFVAAGLMTLGFAFLSLLTGTVASLLVSRRTSRSYESDDIVARVAELERLLRERPQ